MKKDKLAHLQFFLEAQNCQSMLGKKSGWGNFYNMQHKTLAVENFGGFAS